ncbi:hypothetical protein [Neobacillus niacini]|uniref:hypothetical protein n=1 Tax=Neobacillus niacini TaxID=86668 RepID=UPI00285F4041|nr:hypothetical protein [Neobacillus niacini]MDR6999051.1 hypothetical protein [Neobacillus niacini]
MRKKLIWSFIVLILVVSIYNLIIRTRTVTYMGENKNWFIKINAKLVGLNRSYSIEVKYKGKATIQNADFNIHPRHYDLGFHSFNKNGYYWVCKDDCGYYDKDSKLLFFIVWKEKNDTEEKMNFIDLRKINN